MEALDPKSGLTIFILFFGASLLEAIGRANWLGALFWLVIGTVFYIFSQSKANSRCL